MSEKKFVGFEVGFLRVNCYLVPSGDSRILYIIDPGDNALPPKAGQSFIER